MALSDKKLYCGDSKKNLITSIVNLYTDLKDVQGNGRLFNYNGQALYAKWGELGNSKASKLGVRINGVEKVLLTSSVTTLSKTDDFINNRMELKYKYQYASAGGSFGACGNDRSSDCYRTYWVSEQKLPSDASNLRIEIFIRSIERPLYISILYNDGYLGSFTQINTPITVSLPPKASTFTIKAGNDSRSSDFVYSKIDYIKLIYDTNTV